MLLITAFIKADETPRVGQRLLPARTVNVLYSSQLQSRGYRYSDALYSREGRILKEGKTRGTIITYVVLYVVLRSLYAYRSADKAY